MYTRYAQHWFGGQGIREQLRKTMYVRVVVFFEEPGLPDDTKRYRLDISGRREDKEAAAMGGVLEGLLDALVLRDELAEGKILYYP